jgi:predicted DNA-binding ribbon-helix-helix protein
MAAGDTPETERPQKRSFSLDGHRTSISIEAPFWAALQHIATLENNSLAGLVALIDKSRGSAGLSSAVRVWILDYYRARALPPPG